RTPATEIVARANDAINRAPPKRRKRYRLKSRSYFSGAPFFKSAIFLSAPIFKREKNVMECAQKYRDTKPASACNISALASAWPSAAIESNGDERCQYFAAPGCAPPPPPSPCPH